jgi:tetratricopeptide (TPR) repeat protein
LKKVVLILLVFVAFACASKSAEDIFKEAQQHLARQEFKAGVNTMKEILSKYPDNKKWDFKANLEIAKVYHAHAIKSVPKNESLKIAVKYYTRANAIAPDNKEAPKALFLAAFIEANELQEFQKAKDLYTKFVKLYPKSEMTESAKKEIENLGIPPEKIIEKNLKPDEKKKR